MIDRRAIAALTLSAAGFVGILMHEGYTDEAVIPVPGDVPTVGFGTTGGVRMGDRTTPPAAAARALRDVAQFEGALKRCVRVPLSQTEYDVFVSFSYNVGSVAFCKSTLIRKLNAGDYTGACNELMRWTYVAGRDCKKPGSGCAGLVKRRQAERDLCLGEAHAE